MRRLNDIKKVADFIVSNFKSSEFELQNVCVDSCDIIAPHLPSNVISVVSSDIRIGVFPYDVRKVFINIYKL